MELAIETSELTKKFEDVVAVDHLTMGVREGEIFGFLGPNGAGKTTTINMLTTLMRPTSGAARVAGFDIHTNPSRVRQKIGIVFQESVLDNYLTGYENMAVHADLWNVPKSNARERIRELLELVELSDRAKDLVLKYSGGMRRRLEMARGLLGQPGILFLDEPTLGLDPVTRRHIWEYIREIRNERSLTIFLTTHYMDEAQQLCDRVGIIDNGKIVAVDTPQKLIESLGGEVIEVKGQGEVAKAVEAVKPLELVKNVSSVGERGLSMTVLDGESAIPQVLTRLQAMGFVAESVHLKQPSLDDVFLHYTGRSLRDEGPESPWKRAMVLKQMRRVAT